MNNISDKPVVYLIGINGNVFNIMRVVREALIKSGQRDKSNEFIERAMSSESYDSVLALCFDYVDVK